MTPREHLIVAVFVRAGRRAVYGFAETGASCSRVLKGKVPAEFTHLAVERDKWWTRIGREDGPLPEEPT